MSIYVEIRIRAPIDEIWRRTQSPDLHRCWDLRFSDIDYLPRPDVTQPQRFLYATRLGFGLKISGEGESFGSTEDASGARTSVLKFRSGDAKSLISQGAGYWKYVPDAEGVRFFTKYDYETRFGMTGQLFDKFVFRPLMGWATAWSFDCLRLWLEKEIDPTLSRYRTLLHAMTRLTLAILWVYQGVFPKLLFPNSGEMRILHGSGFFVGAMTGKEATILMLVGFTEIIFGGLFLFLWRWRSLFLFNIMVLLALGIGAWTSQKAIFVAPFNPATLNFAMISLSLIGWLCDKDLPSARHCLRRFPRDKMPSEKREESTK